MGDCDSCGLVREDEQVFLEPDDEIVGKDEMLLDPGAEENEKICWLALQGFEDDDYNEKVLSLEIDASEGRNVNRSQSPAYNATLHLASHYPWSKPLA